MTAGPDAAPGAAPDAAPGELLVDLQACLPILEDGARPRWRGRVEQVSGVLVEAAGVPAAMGELCRVRRRDGRAVDAEVVGFRGSSTLLMPHGHLEGIGPRQLVTAVGRPFAIAVGDALLGRVLDGFGAPLDGGAALPRALEKKSVRRDAPDPLTRRPIETPFQTGVRAVDGLMTLGRGQRLGIFAGSGVGKSTLLGQITRGTDADVVVVALVGERGREVRAFVEQVLGEALGKSVVVVATSDRPPIERFMAPFVAITAAEHFRDRGSNVLLVMDSVTRFAAASREIGLAAGEPPTVRGYPPSFFATVPKLVERLGNSHAGSITGLFTVLLDGDDHHDPVADTLRGLLDGHLFLSRELANRGHFPSIDVVASLSRLMPEVVSPEHREVARTFRELLACYEDGRDLVEIGAYKSGTNPELDRALGLLPRIRAFTRQATHEASSFEETLLALARVFEEA